MIRRSWGKLLAGLTLASGLAVPVTASAGEVYDANRAELRCQQLFAESGAGPAVQLTSGSCLSDDCCAPVGCCEATCCAPDGCCDLSCGEGCCDFGEDDGGEINFGGWVQFGYHSRVTPAGAGKNALGSFNNHPHRFNLHQGWLYAEKIADGSDGLDWGFRMDAMYGVDSSDTQAFGNPIGSWDNGGSFSRGAGPDGTFAAYGFAIPQLYAELAAGDISVKVGHFYTLVGYEVVTAPDNFFYSHALTMYNSEPFTHTGAIATYNASDDVTIYGGWTAGWDTGFDRLNGGSNFLGGFSVPLSEKTTLTYINTIGNFGWKGAGASGYAHSIVIDTAVTDSFNYIVQSDVLRVGTIDTVGINQYAIYSLSDKLGVGTRGEWWKNEGNSQYAWTAGLNIKPAENIIIRPEIRYDWSTPNGVERNTTTFGFDAIYTF
ncbi:MAG: outer membrane beta-barrel protein [Planctomycetaceae bacterium]|nr:outer membrane beta-barrel protein [Planctomycetaceae bacterium]